MSDQDRAQQLVEKEILQPMEAKEGTAQKFSRRLLMKPSCTWGVVLKNGLRSFTVRTPLGSQYLGLYEKETGTLYLLNAESKIFVLAADHPYFEQVKNSILLPEEHPSVP
ncbi:hypothetical protein P3T73_03800 [Kiritimatiellota bacterium B12222]|nr:hypothetical protein P3T73_03800 [Kiritimatiellota bacterium B12222]